MQKSNRYYMKLWPEITLVSSWFLYLTKLMIRQLQADGLKSTPV